MSWLRLIRWSNLLIIFLTQGVAWWCVIWPLHTQMHLQLLLTPVNFLLLSASTMLIAAAGYIINDYFDIRIDAINKPESVILEKTIPRRSAIIVHSALNALALLLAGIVAFRGHHMEWLLLQMACIIMLWRYSTKWKRQFMIGNVVVALMTALTIISLIIYEPHINIWYGAASVVPGWHTVILPYQSLPGIALEVFAAFAFILTWMREIVKDMEDYKGDEVEGCITMPIKWGLEKSCSFVQALSLLTVVALGWIGWWLNKTEYLWSYLGLYVILILAIPLVVWSFTLKQKSTKAHYHKKSQQLKRIMVAGILSLIIILLDNV